MCMAVSGFLRRGEAVIARVVDAYCLVKVLLVIDECVDWTGCYARL